MVSNVWHSRNIELLPPADNIVNPRSVFGSKAGVKLWESGMATGDRRETADADGGADLTPAGRANGEIARRFAEFERAILQERVRAGLAHARQNGNRLGRPLYSTDTLCIALPRRRAVELCQCLTSRPLRRQHNFATSKLLSFPLVPSWAAG